MILKAGRVLEVLHGGSVVEGGREASGGCAGGRKADHGGHALPSKVSKRLSSKVSERLLEVVLEKGRTSVAGAEEGAHPDHVSRTHLVSGLRFRASSFGFRVSGFGFRISGFGFRVSGFGIWRPRCPPGWWRPP